MTLEQAIDHVKRNASRREGTAPMVGELFVAEIERLRQQLAAAERRNMSKDALIVLRTMQRDEALAALDRAAPVQAKKLAKKFERQTTMEDA